MLSISSVFAERANSFSSKSTGPGTSVLSRVSLCINTHYINVATSAFAALLSGQAGRVTWQYFHGEQQCAIHLLTLF